VIKTGRHLDKVEGEYPSYPANKKQNALEEWMDKDLKEFYMVCMGSD
jgi:hypothetical protein